MEQSVVKDPIQLAQCLVEGHMLNDKTQENVDVNVEAISSALQTAKAVVEHLQLRIQLHKDTPLQTYTTKDGTVGVPRVHADTIVSSQCQHCLRVFSTFNRTRQCSSCGHTFCPKCCSKQQLLPHSFGFGNEAVRVCELCTQWFQQAVEKVMFAMGMLQTIQERHSIQETIHLDDSDENMGESSEGEEEEDEDEEKVVTYDPLEAIPLSSFSPINVLRGDRNGMYRAASFQVSTAKAVSRDDDDWQSRRARLSSRASSTPKCFDDSDIVDERRVEARSDQRLSQAVLRFAVYDVGTTGQSSISRSLARFGRRNMVLDRYTVDLDCRQGIVRVMSVFMHRFWSFKCDAVEEITSPVAGVAHLVVADVVGHQSHVLEWEFGCDEDRLAFIHALEQHKTSSLFPLKRNMGNTESTTEQDIPRPTQNLLGGEINQLSSDINATLLLGVAGDTIENSIVWARMRGVLSVTNYRVLFMPLEKASASMAYIPLFAILSSSIMYPRSRVRVPRAAPVLVISCKDARMMRIEVEGSPQVVDETTTLLNTTLNQLVDASQRYRTIKSSDAPDALSSIERSDVFAFSFQYSFPAEYNGWKLYSDEREFKRQIAADPMAQSFFKFYQNGRGTMCKSYPTKLLVPSSMNSVTLAKVAEFRAKNRFPVVTYYHSRNRCVLVRSGQPLLGNLLSGSSSLPDQLLIGMYRRFPEIIRTQSSTAPSSRPIYIFDARKLKASTGNRLIGKGGVETSHDYPGAVVCHLNIANMYRMQSSYQALMRLILPGGMNEDKSWYSSLETTKWLHHLQIILDGAVKIARVLELEGSSVLVHCSDGWDRTAQLTALAQLMIDPYYRTIRGFAVLVEKDWCAFGHKFAERTGGDRARDPQQYKSSPIMLQFLDCVWQIQRQFSHAFEFNEQFLLHLANSLTSGLYGTFLYDCRLQRQLNRVEEMTASVWTPVLMKWTMYCNPQYQVVRDPIWPWTSSQMIVLWETYYFQWHPKYHQCRWIASLEQYREERIGDVPTEVMNTTHDSEISRTSNVPRESKKLPSTRNIFLYKR